MTQASSTGTVAEPRDAGNARLRQVRTFIEQAETVQPDMMQMLLGALRGRLLLGAALGLVLGLIGAIAIFFSVAPVFQSQGMMRIVAREAKILYADADDSRRAAVRFLRRGGSELSSQPPGPRAHAGQAPVQAVPDVPADVGDLAKMVQVTGQKGLVTIVVKSGIGCDRRRRRQWPSRLLRRTPAGADGRPAEFPRAGTGRAREEPA